MTLREEIRQAVMQSDGLTARQIAKCIGRKYSTWLRGHIDAMADEGQFNKLKAASTNGRPVFIYKYSAKLRAPRAAYLAARMDGYFGTYEMWLEDEWKKNQSEG